MHQKYLQNPLEFSRQQNGEEQPPEVSQFRASQRLVNASRNVSENPVWNHFDGDRTKAFCKYCNQSYTSGKIARMTEHILVCFYQGFTKFQIFL